MVAAPASVLLFPYLFCHYNVPFTPAALWPPASTPAGTGEPQRSDWWSASMEPAQGKERVMTFQTRACGGTI